MQKTVLFLMLIKLIIPYCLKQSAPAQPNILGFDISPDGKHLAIAHGDRNVSTFYHLENLTHIYTYNFTSWVDRVTYSRNGAYAVVTGTKSYIDILNGTTYQLIRQVFIGIDVTHKAAFSYDDQQLLVCGTNFSIQIWSTINWTKLHDYNQLGLQNQLSPFYDCKFSPNGEFFATGLHGGKVFGTDGIEKIFWNPKNMNRGCVSANGEQFLIMQKLTFWIQSDWNANYANYSAVNGTLDCDYSLDSKYVAISTGNGTIMFYNATMRNKTLLKVEDTKTNSPVSGTRFSPDSKYLAAGSNGTIYLYQYPNSSFHWNCTEVCGDLVTWNYPCDNQKGVPFDGCDDNCQIMPNFTCVVNNTFTTCSYNGGVSINLLSIVKANSAAVNSDYIMTYQIFPLLHAYSESSEDQLRKMFSVDGGDIKDVQYNDVLGIFTIRMTPTTDNTNKTLALIYDPTKNPNPSFFAGKIQKFSYELESPIFVYTYFQQKIITALYYSSYILPALGWTSWILGLLLKKLAGLEAMFVLQFSWIIFVWIDSYFIKPFESIQFLKYSSGYNYHFFSQNATTSKTFPYLSQFKLSSKYFVNNFSFFGCLLVGSLILALANFTYIKIAANKVEINQIKPYEDSSQKQPKLAKNSYQITGPLLMNSVLLSLIHLTSMSTLLFQDTSNLEYSSLGVFGGSCFIIIIIFNFFYFKPSLFGQFTSSFAQQKRFAKYHYFLYAIVLVSAPLLMILFSQYAWMSGIPIALLGLEIVIYRPYKFIKENVRAVFNLLAMGSFVGFKFYAQTIRESEISSNKTYIFLLVIVMGVLSVVVVWSVASSIYSYYYSTYSIQTQMNLDKNQIKIDQISRSNTKLLEETKKLRKNPQKAKKFENKYHSYNYVDANPVIEDGYSGKSLVEISKKDPTIQSNRLRTRIRGKENRNIVVEQDEDANFEGQVIQFKENRAAHNYQEANPKKRERTFVSRSKFLTSNIGNR